VQFEPRWFLIAVFHLARSVTTCRAFVPTILCSYRLHLPTMIHFCSTYAFHHHLFHLRCLGYVPLRYLIHIPTTTAKLHHIFACSFLPLLFFAFYCVTSHLLIRLVTVWVLFTFVRSRFHSYFGIFTMRSPFHRYHRSTTFHALSLIPVRYHSILQISDTFDYTFHSDFHFIRYRASHSFDTVPVFSYYLLFFHFAYRYTFYHRCVACFLISCAISYSPFAYVCSISVVRPLFIYCPSDYSFALQDCWPFISVGRCSITFVYFLHYNTISTIRYIPLFTFIGTSPFCSIPVLPFIYLSSFYSHFCYLPYTSPFRDYTFMILPLFDFNVQPTFDFYHLHTVSFTHRSFALLRTTTCIYRSHLPC